MVRKLLVSTVVIVILIIGYAVYLKFTRPAGSENEIFQMAQSALPSASWSAPKDTTMPTQTGTLNGQEITGSITTQTAMVPHFENVAALTKMGYQTDNNLAADGPGSSQWGYTNSQGETIIYGYRVAGTTNPNEPIQFNCPCKASVSVFVGSTTESSAITPVPTSGNTGLANPASVNCAKVGGTNVIKNGPNGQYGLCDFGDNMACEEWALYRGQCPVGGIKTTGFDNIQQKYCAWIGGKTFAVPNAQCTLPDGTVCSDDALYNGTCPKN